MTKNSCRAFFLAGAAPNTRGAATRLRDMHAAVMVELVTPRALLADSFFAVRGGGVAGETVKGKPEEDQERTNEQGKTSSVHFLHFAFTKAQIEAFKKTGAEIVIGCSHARYQHMAILPENVRETLARDFA